MKRNRQHIIEDESEIFLRTLFPTEWVLRKLSPDYGIDYIVEIFEEEESTGLHFFLQLKGTDKKETNDRISFQLEKKYIEYYEKVSLPVLFLYVGVKSKKAWAKWLNRYEINEGRKSRTIEFTSNDVIDKSKIRTIKDKLTVEHPCIRIKYVNLDDNIHIILNRWISHFFSNNITDKANEIEDEIVISFEKENKNKILLKISDNRFLFDRHIEITDNISEDILLLPEIDNIPKSISCFLYEFSKILLVRNCDSAIYALLKIIPTLTIEYAVDIISLVVKCISKKMYNEIEKLGIELIENSNFDIYQLIHLSTFKFPDDENIIQIKETLLLYAIKKSDDNFFTGMLHYNLANHYQNINNRRKSIKHYLRARKFNPDYLNRGYWYRELAGMLFLEKHYSVAAELYSKCLTYDRHAANSINKALAADAYFMARKFKESLRLFEEYASEVKCPETEFIFKKQVIKSLKDHYDFEKTFSPTQATKLFKLESSKKKPISHEAIRKCLMHDPISADVRFQEGIILGKEREFEEACISFLISALVAEWNTAAWLNSFFMAIETQSHLTGKILYVAYKKCGYKIIEDFRAEILKDELIPIESKAMLIDSMSKQFEDFDKMEKITKG